MCDYDAEEPEFSSTQDRTARKPRRCEECGGVIHVGDRYESMFGKWDGDVHTFARHVHCRDLAKRIADAMCGGRYTIGGLLDSIREHYDEVCATEAHRAHLEAAQAAVDRRKADRSVLYNAALKPSDDTVEREMAERHELRRDIVRGYATVLRRRRFGDLPRRQEQASPPKRIQQAP